MGDEDLSAIRAKRMAELQARSGGMSGRGGGGGADQQKEMQEKQQAMEDMRNSILSQVLTQEARARCK